MSHTRASSLGWKDGSMSSEDATPAPSEEDGVGKDPFGDHVREGSPLVEQLHFRHDSKPVSRRLDPLRGAQRTQEVSSSVKTSRILVVEDNVVNRKVLCSMLKQLGFINVVVAVNGAVAMDLVTGPGAQAFDLCIMDCLMPIMVRSSQSFQMNVQSINAAC